MFEREPSPSLARGAAPPTEERALLAALEVHRQLDLGGQMEALAEIGAAWTGARAAVVLGPAEERGILAVVARWPRNDAGLPRLKPIARDAVRTWFGPGATVFSGLGPLAVLAEPTTGPDPGAIVALPVHSAAHPDWVAVLVLLLDEAPEPRELEGLAALEEQLRSAVHNALQVRAMRELVIKDDTARCFNRRYFESSLPDELARATRFHAALSLIFLDMDNLKEVNKRHGHAMGSRTLLEVSQRIRAKIRRFDRLFRFGGDEFCIVLPETDWHGAIEVAERVRDSIAGRPFLVNELGDPNGVRMTASLGIASYPLHARTQQELVEQADRAMQRIKNTTKNSIGIAEILGDSHGR